MEKMNIHIIKTGLQINKDNLESKPYLLYQNKDEIGKDEIYKYYLDQGKHINFQINQKMKICIGYEPSRGKWSPCPNSNQIEKGLYCQTCAKDDFFTCRKMCQGKFCKPKTTRAKALCDINETVLYLTYVGGKFKVGVSLNPIRRWIEQGSYYSTILTKGNGLTIRYYENYIGNNMDLATVVKNKSKLEFIGKDIPSLDQIKIKFNEIIARIKKFDLFEVNSDLNITDLRSHYHSVPELNRNVIVDNKNMSGEIVGVLGKILVVKDKESYYATELSKVQGRMITQSSKIPKRQRSLFDY